MGAAFAVDHKRDCAMISKQCLEMFQCNPEFLRFITVDETWIHYFTSETKEQSKQWKKNSPDEPAPKKAKTVKSAGKVTATVFFGIHAI